LKEEQRVGRIRRHLFPRPPRSAEEAAARKEEEPIFGGGPLLSFTKEDIPLRVKRMVTYRRLLAKKQIDDAIEWLECLHRPSSQPVLDLLKRARRICVEQKGLDAARLYLQILMPQRGYVIKDGKLTRAGFMHIYRRPRHKLRIVLREMPLAECYQRWYVMKKPPRAMAVDMRLAIHENRVGPRAVREWAPYMTSASRYMHKRELVMSRNLRTWDYYEDRRAWIEKYEANMERRQYEAREARGLPARDYKTLGM
jgi:ribosomal protein L22